MILEALECSFGCSGASLVRVEGQDALLAAPRQQSDVILPEGRSARSHRRVDTCLVQGDHVCVSLNQERSAEAGGYGLGPVEVIEEVALVVDRRLGRVHILRGV